MDLASFLTAVLIALIALFPRIPGLSADDRKRARIQRDVELWKSMPKGAARDDLRTLIDAAVVSLTAARRRDPDAPRQVQLIGLGLIGGGWILLMIATAVTTKEAWGDPLRRLLTMLGGVSAILGTALFALWILYAAVTLVGNVRQWWGRRRSATDGPDQPAEVDTPLSTQQP